MEVSVSALRAELKSWIEKARAGEEVVITDRGVPVARLSGVATADLVTGLVRDGLLTPAQAERPVHSVPAAPVHTAAAPAARPASRMSDLVRRIRR
ncbi:type II toxin-antitoxin system Phd/YefM family antitoxin [Isoptericola variabilis]|uniref:Antitoxin n=1 Tax=Isoptericola variabilis (strain 225) TaxID=743718 RepID=F6FU15_ISOV2|nr:type II toxin-antitoxin system prevent-host-death family antitoxin [Isoptericola variabilis]AEG45386.1 prevent-host-death family protein [Isoptericola variabilis 225]TWH30270.1 prevent-host-death family protein [Isoptericola variabilis J7]